MPSKCLRNVVVMKISRYRSIRLFGYSVIFWALPLKSDGGVLDMGWEEFSHSMVQKRWVREKFGVDKLSVDFVGFPFLWTKIYMVDWARGVTINW